VREENRYVLIIEGERQFEKIPRRGLLDAQYVRFITPPSARMLAGVIKRFKETLKKILMSKWVLVRLLTREWFQGVKQFYSLYIRECRSPRRFWNIALYSEVELFLQQGRGYQDAAAYIFMNYGCHKITTQSLFKKMCRYRSGLSKPPPWGIC